MSEENNTRQENPGAVENHDLGDAGKKALDAERDARKKAEKRLKELEAELEQRDDAGRTESEKMLRKLEKAEARAAELEAEIASRDRALLVREVADEVGVPTNLVGRIQGETRDELIADAQELMESVAPDGPRRPAPVPEAGRGGTPVHTSPAAEFAAFMESEFN